MTPDDQETVARAPNIAPHASGPLKAVRCFSGASGDPTGVARETAAPRQLKRDRPFDI